MGDIEVCGMVSPGFHDGSKPLQISFDQFAIFVADTGRTEQLRKAGGQAGIGIIHHRLRRGQVCLIFVHGSSLPPGTLAYSTYSTPHGLPITGG